MTARPPLRGIRRPDLDDLEALLALLNDPGSVHNRTTCRHREAPEDARELYERLAEDENLVIDEDGEPVAYASWQVYGPWVHLNVMAVHARRQRAGLGTAMLAAFEDRARAEGAAGYTLRAYVDSPWAIAFYERLGLTRIATRSEWAALDAALLRHLSSAALAGRDPEPGAKVLFYRRLS